MVKLIGHKTGVEPAGLRRWKLVLTFESTRPFDVAHVKIGLDHSMAAVPHQANADLGGVDISPSGPNLALGRLTETITPNEVAFVVGSFRPGTQMTKETLFNWRVSIPPRLNLLCAIQQPFGMQIEELVGYRTDDGPLKSIVQGFTRGPGTAFFFRGSDSELELPFDALVPFYSATQHYPGTWSCALTTPFELAYWKSSEAENYLALQLNRRHIHQTEPEPRRLALCPFSLQTPEPLCTEYLEALQVQSSCGIHIRVVSPEVVESSFGSNTGFASYGDVVGFRIANLLSTQERSCVYFDRDSATHIRARFDDVYCLGGIPWTSFKNRHKVSFTALSLARINAKIAAIRSRMRHPIHCSERQSTPLGQQAVNLERNRLPDHLL